MKILIAEDDRFIREGLQELLESEGYQTSCASDGEEALRIFNKEKPDFVLLDIMMPKKDGFALCRDIRKEDSEVPIIFISAKSEEIDRVVGLELGADDYIMKPFGTPVQSFSLCSITPDPPLSSTYRGTRTRGISLTGRRVRFGLSGPSWIDGA